MFVFIDTEFTSLDADAKLISIGLVAQDGRTFYAESSEFVLSDCSDFVREVVLPLLDAPARHTLDNIGQQAKDWLAQFGGVTMLSDAPDYDWVHVQRIFRDVGWPENLRKHAGHLAVGDSDLSRKFLAALARAKVERCDHHALDDAMANMQAYHEIRRRFPSWRPKF